MNTQQLTEILKAAFPEAVDIHATGEGNKFDLRVVSDQFKGKRPVQRQQAVYAPLNAFIATGEIHALGIKAYTPEEWRKASLFGG